MLWSSRFFIVLGISLVILSGYWRVEREHTVQETELKTIHSWCTFELCTEEALAQETRERGAITSRANDKNLSVLFSQENLVEQAFMNIFYSRPAVLQGQKLVVVSTSYNYPPRYPLDWINAQPWPVFVSTKEKSFSFSSEPWGNVGQEIASYMRFILLFWDFLPEHVAFVHGHEKAWHQEGYLMSYMLRNVCFQKFEYISLSAFESDAWRPIKGSMSYFDIIKRYWKLVKPYLGDLPKRGFKEKCCAQFIVSRDRIKARPRELYELILHQMTDHKKKYRRAPHGRNNGWDLIHFWEAIWHYIMGEDAIVNTRKKYGIGIDLNAETRRPLSKNPLRTLKNVMGCEHENKRLTA